MRKLIKQLKKHEKFKQIGTNYFYYKRTFITTKMTGGVFFKVFVKINEDNIQIGILPFQMGTHYSKKLNLNHNNKDFYNQLIKKEIYEIIDEAKLLNSKKLENYILNRKLTKESVRFLVEYTK